MPQPGSHLATPAFLEPGLSPSAHQSHGLWRFVPNVTPCSHSPKGEASFQVAPSVCSSTNRVLEAWGGAQVVECLPSKYTGLSSKPKCHQKKKKNEEKKECWQCLLSLLQLRAASALIGWPAQSICLLVQPSALGLLSTVLTLFLLHLKTQVFSETQVLPRWSSLQKMLPTSQKYHLFLLFC
jgi:hypothetical protein